MKLISIVCFVLCALLMSGGIAMASAPNLTLLEDFQDPAGVDRWDFSNGPEFPGAAGSFERSSQEYRSGTYSGKLNFDFRGGGNYVLAGISLPSDTTIRQVRFWMKKTTGNKITVRCNDSEGQTFQKSFNYAYPGWQEVAVSTRGWSAHWGGAGDGVFRGSPTFIGIIVENDAERTGEVYIDDVSYSSDELTPPGSFTTPYVVKSFDTEERWRITSAGNPGESNWETPVFHYDFSQGATSVGIETDVALMGRPTQITVRLKGDGSGHNVRLRIGSHFQNFDRVLGQIGEGEQTFTVEMGSMQGWRFYGGQNDGIPIYPLRVTGIILDREDGAQKGDLEMLEVTAETLVPPEQGVVLIPEGSIQNDTARFSLDLRNLLPETSNGRLSYAIRDWSGVTLHEGETDLSIEQGKTVSYVTTREMSDYSFLECVFNYYDNGFTYGPSVASAVRTMDDPGDPTLQPESPFGMGLYLYRYPNNPDGLELMDRAAAMGQAAGVKWSREEFLWHRIEPREGEFDWSFYDRVVETANSHGISVYGLITYWSNWTEPYTQKGIEDYARYCKALVNRYKDRIKHWEVWNEPNIFFWSGPKEMYADLLKAAYAAIKEADPEALVLGCSTAGIDAGFIEMVMDAGAPYDILTIHPYRGSLNDRGFMKEMQDTSELTARDDGIPKPVWITEMGLPTQLYGGLSERNQATFLARCYLSAVASGVDTNVSWYNFREDGENPFYNEHRFGVVRHSSLAPKPGYRALATVCRTLAGQSVSEDIELASDVLSFRFTGGDGETVVIWSPGRETLLHLNIQSDGDYQLIDLMGEQASTLSAAESVLLPLQANSPVFLTGQNLQVSAAPTALEVDLPRSVQAGDNLTMQIRMAGPFESAELTLSVPDGWQFNQLPAGFGQVAYQLNVPETELQGRKELNLHIKLEEMDLALPYGIEIVPQLIEI